MLATDTYYRKNQAMVAGVLFQDWPDSAPVKEVTVCVEGIRKYEPGRFYRRELPCILAMLDEMDVLPDVIMPEVIIIDGFVYFGSQRYPALGRHLYDALNERVPVIGVAKNPAKNTPAEYELCRGNSRRPLYITAAGMALDQAKKHIADMHGHFRIPALIKRADQLSRAAASPLIRIQNPPT